MSVDMEPNLQTLGEIRRGFISINGINSYSMRLHCVLMLTKIRTIAEELPMFFCTLFTALFFINNVSSF